MLFDNVLALLREQVSACLSRISLGAKASIGKVRWNFVCS